MKLVTLGPKGTVSSSICEHHFPRAKIDMYNTIEHVFDHITEYDGAIVPLSNSQSGYVLQTLTNILACPYEISQVFSVDVGYDVVGYGPLDKVHTLFAFPLTYQQCYQNLKDQFPDSKLLYTSSNGMSAQNLRLAKSEGYAAILPKGHHSFEMLKANVNDCARNETSFALLEKPKKRASARHFILLFSNKKKEELLSSLKKTGTVHSFEQVRMKRISSFAFAVEYEGSLQSLHAYNYKYLGNCSLS